MPLYEFECKNCGGIIEKLMKVSDPNPEVCDLCNGGPLVKLMSRTNFVLKGQGWYETDFKHNGKAPKTQSSEASEGSSETTSSTSSSEKSSTSESKTDAKPASTAKPKAKEG